MKRHKINRVLILLLLTATACGARGGAGVTGYDELIESLRSEGAAVEPVRQIDQVFFTATGQVIAVNGVEVQVFEYIDEQARQAEAATISADGSSVGTSMITWVEPPHFFTQGRLIVLYVGTESATLALLSGALGAPIAEGVSAQPGY